MTEPDDPAVLLRTIDSARRRDRARGLVILIFSFAFGLAVSLWARRQSQPELATPPGPPTTAGVVGFPRAVDVVKSLNGARAVTKRTLLRGIWAEGVKSDGTIDVSDGSGRARYTFQSLEGQGPQPPHDPGTLPRRNYCGRQTVHLRREGLVADPDVTDYPCPPQITDPLPEPRCGFADIWRKATAAGAPSDRMARIEYYRARVGPAWRFEVPGTPTRFSFYGDCGRKLDEAEAANAP